MLYLRGLEGPGRVQRLVLGMGLARHDRQAVSVGQVFWLLARIVTLWFRESMAVDAFVGCNP